MSQKAINSQVIRELAIQLTAQEDLYFFARFCFMKRYGYQWQKAAHHKTICDALMRVVAGTLSRLIINIPPRYSKTELAVINFIAWSLGHFPDAAFIYTSYSARLAANHAYQVREFVTHPAYQAIFPGIQLKDDSRAKDEWRTTHGGVVYAVGAGGTITGYGAGKHRETFGGAIIIDDPHKADEAKSSVMRQNVIDWFQNTLETRKNSPNTPIILIMQRLHENDLAGWLLEGKNGEQWEHICYPAITENGEALWPQKHSIETLRQMEKAAPYVFAGQYLQKPAPPQGGLFKPDCLIPIEALPAINIEWVRGWDLAASVDGDYTAGAKLGKLPDGRFVIADMVRSRLMPDTRDAILQNIAKKDGVATRISLPQDPGQAGKTQILYLTRQLAGFSVKTSPESGDKITRAMPLAAQINVGNVLMLKGSWNESMINEMQLFPNGTYDDQIDALSRAFETLMGSKFGMLDWIRGEVEN
jgi:predicted phage terminase large subunit-like protein